MKRVIDLCRRLIARNWFEFLKFCLVGSSGIFVNLGVYSFGIYALRIHYLVSSIGAQTVAMTTNFLLNKYFTFKNMKSSASALARQYVSFALSCVLGMLVNTGVLFALVQFFKVQQVVAQLAAIGAAAMFNFVCVRAIAFKRPALNAIAHSEIADGLEQGRAEGDAS